MFSQDIVRLKICGDSWDSNTSRSPVSCTKGVQTNRQTQYPPKKSTQRRNVTHFDPSLKILFQQKDKEVDFFPGFSIKFLMYFWTTAFGCPAIFTSKFRKPFTRKIPSWNWGVLCRGEKLTVNPLPQLVVWRFCAMGTSTMIDGLMLHFFPQKRKQPWTRNGCKLKFTQLNRKIIWTKPPWLWVQILISRIFSYVFHCSGKLLAGMLWSKNRAKGLLEIHLLVSQWRYFWTSLRPVCKLDDWMNHSILYIPYHPWDWYIYLHDMVDFYGINVGKYTIHGWYGIDWIQH